MRGCLVFAGGLWGASVGGLRGLVFPSARRCAVGLSEGSDKVSVHSFVPGCCIASVAGGHLGKGEGRKIFINIACPASIFLSCIMRFRPEGTQAASP